MSKNGLVWLGLVLICFACSSRDGKYVQDGESSSTNAAIQDPDWAVRMSGSSNVHFVSLMSPISYSDAWVYQFGDFNSNPEVYKDWPDEPHNMECGPAAVQIIERLSGRKGMTCDYLSVVPGCEAYPYVHTNCRAVGACGKFSKGVGYDDSSFDGSSAEQLKTVLDSLGHEAIIYSKSNGNPVNLSIIKNAIDINHSMIVALSPAHYWKEVYKNSTNVDSHFVVVEGYGDSCKNEKFDSSLSETPRQGYVYISDPGWNGGALICISENVFNKALDEEYDPSTYTGIEVIRAGSEGMKKATWYPPGTLLRIDGEYYSVVLPDDAGRMRYKHASNDALKSNRISTDRAIEVSKNVLGCAIDLGEMDTAVRYREYRDEQTRTIYLVDLILHERKAFISLDAYLSYDGKDEWKNATTNEKNAWASYSYAGLLGLAPGILFKTTTASTVWVVVRSANQQAFRAPIASELTAKSFGYDMAKFGVNPKIATFVSEPDLDVVAGKEGQMLTEEMSLDCNASRCMAATNCFTLTSNIGGGEDLIGDGACGSCINEVSVISPGSSISIASVSSGGSSSTGVIASSGGSVSSSVQHCVHSTHRCTANPNAYQICILDSYTGGTDWMDFECPSGQTCEANTGSCVIHASASTGGASATGGTTSASNPSTVSVALVSSNGGSSVGGSSSFGGTSLVSTGGSSVTMATGGFSTSSGGSSSTSLTNSYSSGGAGFVNANSTGGLPSFASSSSSFHLHYEGPIKGEYWIGGWWHALDGRKDVLWETSLQDCVDSNIEDQSFDCDLDMIPSGNQNFSFQIYLPDGRFWGDESCDPKGGCGSNIGTVTLTKGSSSVNYTMTPNPSGAPYYNGLLSVVP